MPEKTSRSATLYARWNYGDTMEEPFPEEALTARERLRCHEIGLIVSKQLSRRRKICIRCCIIQQVILLLKNGK